MIPSQDHLQKDFEWLLDLYFYVTYAFLRDAATDTPLQPMGVTWQIQLGASLRGQPPKGPIQDESAQAIIGHSPTQTGL